MHEQMLTELQMQELTKAKQAAKQASILDENGIYYIRRADNSITTTWHHVNNPCNTRINNDETPNFEAIN